MKKITLIKMNGCPYCASALRAIEELKTETPDYAALPIDIIDENEQPDLAQPYAKDYYYVPTFFVDGQKFYEAHPGDDDATIKKAVRKVFQTALS